MQISGREATTKRNTDDSDNWNEPSTSLLLFSTNKQKLAKSEQSHDLRHFVVARRTAAAELDVVLKTRLKAIYKCNVRVECCAAKR